MRVGQIIFSNTAWDPRPANHLYAMQRWFPDIEPVLITIAENSVEPPYVLQRDDDAPLRGMRTPATAGRRAKVEHYRLDPRSLPAWREAIERLNLDIVHVHELTALQGLLVDWKAPYVQGRAGLNNMTQTIARELPIVPWKAGSRLVYDVHECERARSEKTAEENAWSGILEDRLLLEGNVDAVITTSPTQAEVLETFLFNAGFERAASSSLIVDSPNGPPLALGPDSYATRNAGRRALGIRTDAYVAVWAGALTPRRFPIHVATNLIAHGFAVVALATFGEEDRAYAEQLESLGVCFFEPVPTAYHHDDLKDSLQSALAIGDVGLCFNDLTSLNNVIASPNKLWEYASAGVPCLLTNCAPDAEELFGREAVLRPGGYDRWDPIVWKCWIEEAQAMGHGPIAHVQDHYERTWGTKEINALSYAYGLDEDDQPDWSEDNGS